MKTWVRAGGDRLCGSCGRHIQRHDPTRSGRQAKEQRAYAHMCRDGHIEIGHNDSEHEQCPLCRLSALYLDAEDELATLAEENARLLGEVSAQATLRQAVETERDEELVKAQADYADLRRLYLRTEDALSAAQQRLATLEAERDELKTIVVGVQETLKRASRVNTHPDIVRIVRVLYEEGLKSDLELTAAQQRIDVLREALEAARNVCTAFAKQAGYLPAQGGYSTRMSENERYLFRTVKRLDDILRNDSEAALAAPEPPK